MYLPGLAPGLAPLARVNEPSSEVVPVAATVWMSDGLSGWNITIARAAGLPSTRTVPVTGYNWSPLLQDATANAIVAAINIRQERRRTVDSGGSISGRKWTNGREEWVKEQGLSLTRRQSERIVKSG